MTKPINEILPREIQSQVRQTLTNFSELIDEFVNFGTHVFKWVIEQSKGSDEQMPLMMFLRDMLEKADSISILIKNSSVDPSKVILRSLFELHLFVCYLLEEHFTDRSMSFLVWDAKRKIRLNKKFDKDSSSFQQTKKLMLKDKSIDYPTMLDHLPSVRPALDTLNSLLKREEYIRINKEYERTKRNGPANPSWYSLFNGPKNVQELAFRVEVPFLYEILYRDWSGNVHSTDVVSGKIVKKKGSNALNNKVEGDIIQIRLPKDAQSVVSYTLILMLRTFIFLRDKKIPDKDSQIKEWHLSIKDAMRKVTQKEKIIKIQY